MYYNMCIMNVAYQDAPHGRISQKYVDDIEKAFEADYGPIHPQWVEDYPVYKDELRACAEAAETLRRAKDDLDYEDVPCTIAELAGERIEQLEQELSERYEPLAVTYGFPKSPSEKFYMRLANIVSIRKAPTVWCQHFFIDEQEYTCVTKKQVLQIIMQHMAKVMKSASDERTTIDAVRSFLKHNTLADRRLDAPYIEERLRELLTFYDEVEKNGL